MIKTEATSKEYGLSSFVMSFFTAILACGVSLVRGSSFSVSAGWSMIAFSATFIGGLVFAMAFIEFEADRNNAR